MACPVVTDGNRPPALRGNQAIGVNRVARRQRTRDAHQDCSERPYRLETRSKPFPPREKSAIDAVELWRCEPATILNVPVAVYFTVFVDFKLH